jgi:glycosyltransferase A (GT-A) superfamily protein (DUF2064 family)
MEGVLLLVAKQPVVGSCKTRLAEECGRDAAATVARAMISDIVGRLGAAEELGGITKCIMYAPTSARSYFQSLVEELLGDRAGAWTMLPLREELLTSSCLTNILQGAVDDARAHIMTSAAEPIVLIGMDCPDLPHCEIVCALQAARSGSAYLCPAGDGGYVLLGLPSEVPGGVFEGVDWSMATTAVSQIRALNAHGLRVQIGPTYADIDEAPDLFRLATSPHLQALCPRSVAAAQQCYRLKKRKSSRGTCMVAMVAVAGLAAAAAAATLSSRRPHH